MLLLHPTTSSSNNSNPGAPTLNNITHAQYLLSPQGSLMSDCCSAAINSAAHPTQDLTTHALGTPCLFPLSCRIPFGDLLGSTVLLLTCSYKGKEFVRVGYYVNIEYTDPELAEQNPPPNPPRIDLLQRNIMAGECCSMYISSCVSVYVCICMCLC